MRILDHHNNRLGPTERVEQRPCERKPIDALRRGRVRRRRHEQLAHRAKRNRHRQRLAGPHSEPHAPTQPRPQRAHQRRLPDPRLARDQDKRARSRARRFGRLDKRLQFSITLEQSVHENPIVIAERSSGIAAKPIQGAISRAHRGPRSEQHRGRFRHEPAHLDPDNDVTRIGHKHPRRRGPDAPARTEAALAPRVAAHPLFASSEASRVCGPSVAATAEAKSPGFVHARACSRGRHRRASRTCIQRLRVSRPKSQETRCRQSGVSRRR